MIHASQGQTATGGQVEAAGNAPEQIYARESRGQSQARMIETTAADVESLQGIRDMYRAVGWTEREAEAESWLAVAQQDHAAAVAGIDYRDLAAMGTESVMTEPALGGYPEAGREAGQ